ncbi:MAG TPA: hypothetical protein PK482_06460 [Spirochaetota bacterium]|nr:hypothetical protein [Spirochaetota bacterium]
MLKRTPLLAFIIAGIMTLLIALLFQEEDRSFTTGQTVIFYFFSFFPSMGIAMLFDPFPKKIKEMYLKINFYIQEENPEDQVAKVLKEELEGKN